MLLVASSVILLCSSMQPAGARIALQSALRDEGSAARPHHVPALTNVGSDALTRAHAAGVLTDAQYALERASSLFHPREEAARFRAYGSIRPHPAEATMILLDLALRLAQLSPDQQRQAKALLARPTDGPSDPGGTGYTPSELATATSSCSTHLCIHWVTTGSDAISTADGCTTMDTSAVAPVCSAAGANGIPDYVDTVKDVLEHVWTTEISTFGFKSPKDDSASTNTNGGNPDAKIDVFLTGLRSLGLYGYCTSDDPHLGGGYSFYDMSSYCVLDNLYTGYGYSEATIPMKVTAAHEFFHASQFAYDITEDRWFMEGTAAWMEDQVYDNLSGNDSYDDNYQYLADSPLTSPQTSLDDGDNSRFWLYGTWLFWRFLSEYSFPTGGVVGTGAVKEVWDRADGSDSALGVPGSPGPDDYSTQALVHVVVAHGTTFRDAFAVFGQWIADPAKKFSEGAFYPSPAMTETRVLTGAKPSRRPAGVTLRHMSERLYMFKPGVGVKANAVLSITLKGTSGSQPEASAVVVLKSGNVHYIRFKLGATGDGVAKVKFGRGIVRRVIFVVGDAGTRFKDCWLNSTFFSCSGVSLDNKRRFTYSARQS